MAPRSSTSLCAKALQPGPAPAIRAASCSTLHRRLLRPIGIDGSPLAFVQRDRMLANALVVSRIEDANPQASDMRDHFVANVARRRRIVRAVHFDIAVEVHRALADAVVLKARRRQRLQERPLLFEHGAHLPLGRAVNARRRPALVPASEVRVLFLDALEASCL